MDSLYNPQELPPVTQQPSRFIPTNNFGERKYAYAILEDYYIQGGFHISNTISGSTPFPSGWTDCGALRRTDPSLRHSQG